MRREFVINSKESRSKAVDAVMEITREPLRVVTISEYKNDRSAAQNRLLWAFLTDCQRTTCNEHTGNMKEWWHDHFKGASLLNIYVREDRCGKSDGKKYKGISETMDMLYDVKVAMGTQYFEELKKIVVEGISTTWANVELFTEYLRSIEYWCHSVGITLRTDSADYKKAMGIK